MTKPITRHGGFQPEAGRAQNGLCVVFDLKDFSQFFNQPDIHEYVPIYLNRVTEAFETCIFGGKSYWHIDASKHDTVALPILPVHRKFLGDGMLYVWSLSGQKPAFVELMHTYICNRLWNLQRSFARINKGCSDMIPFQELPPNIRVGIGRGTIYELPIAKSTSKEYIGFCINLASRLQNYCEDLAFIASARLKIKEAELEKHGYRKVVATKIKGFPKEIVIVDKAEYGLIPEKVRAELFEDDDPVPTF